jgi:hypothetical protein
MYLYVIYVYMYIVRLIRYHVRMDRPPFDTTHVRVQRLGLDGNMCPRKSEININAWVHIRKSSMTGTIIHM